MSWKFSLSWNLSWNLLFSEFLPGNVLEFFCTVCLFFTVIISVSSLGNFVFYILTFSFWPRPMNMAKCNCTFNNDWLIELEKVPMRELHIVNYATIHLIFPIWKEMQLLAFQMWRSARIREFLESHFQYHFLQKRKAMLWILLCRV